MNQKNRSKLLSSPFPPPFREGTSSVNAKLKYESNYRWEVDAGWRASADIPEYPPDEQDGKAVLLPSHITTYSTEHLLSETFTWCRVS